MRSLSEVLDNKVYGSSTAEIARRVRNESRFEPKYQEYEFGESLEDDYGNDFKCIIKYCYYEHEDFYLGHCKRVVEYSVEPVQSFKMTDESLNTSLTEAIRFHLGGGNNIVFEVKEPKFMRK